MKTSTRPLHPQVPAHFLNPSASIGLAHLTLFLILLLGASPRGFGQAVFVDSFDSYSSASQMTAAGWILSSLNPALVTTTFPAVGTGKGLRIQANPVPDTAPAVGLWYRTTSYTDFYVSLDIASWPGTDKNQALVLFGRMTDGTTGTIPPNLNPATAQGVICNYDASQYGENPNDRRQGQLQMNLVFPGFATITIAVTEITFVPGRPYRLVFKGEGAHFTAQAYDLHDLTAPLVTLEADDITYSSGGCGILGFSRQGNTGTVDITVDNYYCGPSDPNPATPPALAHPIAGTPQVLTRTPTNRFTNFHPASSGISFTAATFSTNQINASATKLYLNGKDVSSALQPFPVNGSTVAFSTAPGTLQANRVYAGRIEVQDTAGTLTGVNTFWFDTFSDAYISTPPVKTIECEDYNYSSGMYQLDPIPVSGFDTNFTPVNGGGVGYLDLIGTPDVDFHDNRTSSEGGWNDFRLSDAVGTSQGNKDIEDGNHMLTDPLPAHLQRQKYAQLGVQEYVVARTEMGEWLNYTRDFAPTNYHVFLRCGSFGATEASLDLVGGDPTTTSQTTTPLGTFSIPNQMMHINYAYVPLLNGGAPVILPLAGTNTLRLTMLGTQGQDNRKLYLNYLLFVPTSDVPTVFDDFNDGNDSAPPVEWVRYNPIMTGSWSFPGGNTYRIQSAPSPDPLNLLMGRAGSYVSASYGDFCVIADVVAWDDSIRQAFGVMARVANPGAGTSTGYAFVHDRIDPSSPSAGDMSLVRLDFEFPSTLKTGDIHFEPGVSYRLVFTGAADQLRGQVYELPNLSTPVVDITATDATYQNGVSGLLVANYQADFAGPADATFDNFLATTAEPRIAVSQSGGTVALSWPLIPFRLISASSLSEPTWTEVTSGITEAGGQKVYMVPATGARYFRLVYP